MAQIIFVFCFLTVTFMLISWTLNPFEAIDNAAGEGLAWLYVLCPFAPWYLGPWGA